MEKARTLIFNKVKLGPAEDIPTTIPGGVKFSKNNRRRRVFPGMIRNVPNLDGTGAIVIKPCITRRERFRRGRDEPAHPLNNRNPHLFCGDRSVAGDEAGSIPVIAGEEVAQSPPISSFKVP